MGVFDIRSYKDSFPNFTVYTNRRKCVCVLQNAVVFLYTRLSDIFYCRTVTVLFDVGHILVNYSKCCTIQSNSLRTIAILTDLVHLNEQIATIYHKA